MGPSSRRAGRIALAAALLCFGAMSLLLGTGSPAGAATAGDTQPPPLGKLSVPSLVHAPAPVARVGRRAGGQKVTVSPGQGLIDISGDGQNVTVTWSGFPRGSLPYLRECVRDATDASTQCSDAGFQSTCGVSCPGITTLGLSDKSGSGSAVATVAIGTINGTATLDPIAGKTITCDYQNPCSLYVGTDPFDISTMVQVPIGFAVPPTACPTSGAPIRGDGISSGKRIVAYDWATKVCKPPLNLSLGYTLPPAGDPKDSYVGGLDDYAVSSQPLDAAQTSALKGSGRSVGYAPVFGSAMVFAYRIFDPNTGSQINDLTLTPGLLAEIFTGQLSLWYQDKQIQRLNPHDSFPTYMATIGRGDANEDTLAMTSWMWANARKTWIAGGAKVKGANPFATGPTDLLPSLGQIALVTGPDQEARVLARGDGDVVSISTYGWIGYVDSSYAAQYDLPTVRILYPSGKTVQATTKTIEKGIVAMKPDPAGLLQPDYSLQRSDTWPMPRVSYMLVPRGASEWKHPPDHRVIAGLQNLVRFGVNKGQSELPLGYVPLPRALVGQAHAVADQIAKAPPLPGHSPSPPPPPPSSPVSTPPQAPPPSYGSSFTGSPAPPPSSPVPPAPSGSPATTIVFVSPTPPPLRLVSSSARMVLPAVMLVGLVSLALGSLLLFGDVLARKVAPVFGRVGRGFPFHRGRHRGSSS